MVGVTAAVPLTLANLETTLLLTNAGMCLL